MNQTKTVLSIRKKRILTYLNSPTFRYQQTLIMLLFVSATLIFLDLGVFSASFIFGASLILITLSRKPTLLKPKGMMWFLFAFVVIALISLVFSELTLTFRHLKIYIQTIYWFFLAVIVCNIYPLINKHKLSKYILYSVLLLLLLYVSGFKVGAQNSVAFTVIIFAPLGYYSIKKFWTKMLFAFLLIFLMLLNGSRSGAIITFVQWGLMILLTAPEFKKYFKRTLTMALILLLLINTESVRVGIGYIVEPYNAELALLLKDPDFVMSNDMSWLTREAQIQKAKQLFAEHPILGIGYSNFVDYDIIIDEKQIASDRPLKGIDNRSAHNSYIEILSETGLFGFISFILFIMIVFLRFWRNISKLNSSFEVFVFISLVGLIVYFYTISSYLGTSSWIMYGLFAGTGNYLIKRNKIITKK